MWWQRSVSDNATESPEPVEAPSRPNGIADTEGHLAGAYGATDRTLVLIRPDGYVGLISDAGDACAVSDYLASIGGPVAL